MANDKVAAAIHPGEHKWDVVCDECGHLITSWWQDVAERVAQTHEDARGHAVQVLAAGK